MTKLYDRARVATATTGDGTVLLGSAVTGYMTFLEAGIQDADQVSYAIEDGDDFEIGLGTYSSIGNTLTRDIVRKSKIANVVSASKIELSGSAVIFITALAEDIKVADLGLKSPCRVATTANITLAGEQTIDSISAVTGDRVLVKDQADATENGIYVCSVSAWARATDFDEDIQVATGARVYVISGSGGGLDYEVTTANPIVMGTSNITITAFSPSANADISLDSSPTLGGDLDGNGNDVSNVESLYLAEQAAAKADTAGSGQFWVKDDTPNVPMFTDDAGTDIQIQAYSAGLDDIRAIAPTQGIIIAGDGSNWVGLGVGSNDQVLTAASAESTGLIWNTPAVAIWTYGSAVATTSGTSVTLASGLTGADVSEIEIMFRSISTDGENQQLCIRIGDSGGIEATGYISTGVSSSGLIQSLAGFILTDGSNLDSIDEYHGIVRLHKYNNDPDNWTMSGTAWYGEPNVAVAYYGHKVLSDALTQIAITTIAGSASFAGGEVSVRYK